MKRLLSLLVATLLVLTMAGAFPVAVAETYDETIDWWYYANPDVLVTAESLSDTAFGKEYSKRMGVNINFIHPPIGQETEQFNLIVASGTYYDLMSFNYTAYPGGATKAIEDGVILNLTEYYENGQIPNMKATYEQYPMFEKLAKLDDGSIYCFPMIRVEDELSTYIGLTLRADWLEALGMDVPKTYDELEAILVAFKEEKGADYPLTTQMGFSPTLTGGYRVAMDMFINDDGSVAYGYVENGYKDYLTMMNRWYDMGLLDPEFTTQDRATIDAKITGSRSGAYLGTPDSWLGTYMRLMTEVDPSVNMVGLTGLRVSADDPPAYCQKDWEVMINSNQTTAITPAADNVEKCIEILDYLYGEEGNLLANFGIEGESYELDANGDPQFVEWITANPEGLTMKQTMGQYAPGGLGYFPGNQNAAPVAQQRFFPCQNEAIAAWIADGDESFTWRFPPISPSVEESDEYADLITDIKTYADENYIRFVSGQRSLDEFDQYVQEMKNMGVERAVEIMQSAYDRFNAR